LLEHPQLSEKFRMLAPDFPGHGDTTSGSDPLPHYTVQGLASFTAEFVKELIDGPLVLAGHSLGGHIAIQASPSVAGLKGLFAAATPPLTMQPQESSPFLNHPALPFLFTAELTEADAELLADSFSSMKLPGVAEAILKTDPEFRSELGQSVQAGELSDEAEILNSLPFPAALALGEDDPLISRDYIESLQLQNLWKKQLQIIPGSGHSPQAETPVQFAALLLDYLDPLNGDNP
jgi:pimeloyl-ACP methyl ester carboxylesterase